MSINASRKTIPARLRQRLRFTQHETCFDSGFLLPSGERIGDEAMGAAAMMPKRRAARRVAIEIFVLLCIT